MNPFTPQHDLPHDEIRKDDDRHPATQAAPKGIMTTGLRTLSNLIQSSGNVVHRRNSIVNCTHESLIRCKDWSIPRRIISIEKIEIDNFLHLQNASPKKMTGLVTLSIGKKD